MTASTLQHGQLIPIIEHDGRTAVNLRDLHTFLEVKRDFSNWAKQMFDYGFVEGQDYVEVFANSGENSLGGRPQRNYAVTLDMAKEVSMIQRTEKGKQARQYFIEVEKRGTNLSDDEILHRAFQISTRRVKALEAKVEEDAPKVEYHDTFVADGDSVTLRAVASSLDVPENLLRELLVANEWIYREESERYSEKRQAKVKQYRYSEYSHKKTYFLRRHNHDAPRFRGEIDWTLKVTPEGMSAIERLVKRVVDQYGSLQSAVETLEAKRQQRIATRNQHHRQPDLWAVR
jgi:phage anti-repressor protein